MAGYSGTPLPKKLGIQSQFRVAFFRLPPDERTRAARLRRDLRQESGGIAQAVSPLCQATRAGGHAVGELAEESSGVTTDLAEDDVRGIGLKAGLVDVKVCAVSEIWSGLKFVIRVKDRPKKA